MKNKTKILSDLSKMAVEAMGAFEGIKNEIQTLVKIRVEKTINRMHLVKRDEFEVLKKLVQKHIIENKKSKKSKIKRNSTPKKRKKRSKN